MTTLAGIKYVGILPRCTFEWRGKAPSGNPIVVTDAELTNIVYLAPFPDIEVSAPSS